jgi:hypothetical protein
VKPYKNLSGDSGVTGFESKKNSIDVRFTNKSVYTYDKSGVGAANLKKMEQLAKAGAGLSTLIDTNPTVRYGYTRRRGAK